MTPDFHSYSYGPILIEDAARFATWEEYFEDWFGRDILILVEREWTENG